MALCDEGYVQLFERADGSRIVWHSLTEESIQIEAGDALHVSDCEQATCNEYVKANQSNLTYVRLLGDVMDFMLC